MKSLATCLLVLLLVYGTGRARPRSLRKKGTAVPVRLDLHLCSGIARGFSYDDDAYGGLYVVDFDVRALVNPKHIRKRVPKKYRALLGDEIYAGHMLIPRTVAWNGGGGYIDWQPLGISLFKRPLKKINEARFNVKTGLHLLGAWRFFRNGEKWHHFFRPGLGLRAAAAARVCKVFSLKVSLFQNLTWPGYVTVEGKRKNVVPSLSAATAGIIVHLPVSFKM